MNAQQLHDLLEEIPDTRELVVASPEPDGLLAAWRAADAEASRALSRWHRSASRETFSTYRAAADRADAAQEALARRVRG
jgi:hypothetical protein